MSDLFCQPKEVNGCGFNCEQEFGVIVYSGVRKCRKVAIAFCIAMVWHPTLCNFGLILLWHLTVFQIGRRNGFGQTDSAILISIRKGRLEYSNTFDGPLSVQIGGFSLRSDTMEMSISVASLSTTKILQQVFELLIANYGCSLTEIGSIDIPDAPDSL